MPDKITVVVRQDRETRDVATPDARGYIFLFDFLREGMFCLHGESSSTTTAQRSLRHTSRNQDPCVGRMSSSLDDAKLLHLEGAVDVLKAPQHCGFGWGDAQGRAHGRQCDRI